MRAKLKGDRFTARCLFPDCKFKLNEKDKHVDAIGVCCRTRVRVPPSPILDDSPQNFPAVVLYGDIDYFIAVPGGIVYYSEIPEP